MPTKKPTYQGITDMHPSNRRTFQTNMMSAPALDATAAQYAITPHTALEMQFNAQMELPLELHGLPLGQVLHMQHLASSFQETLNDIAHPDLRNFLECVLYEPQIHSLVTLPLVRHGIPLQFPIQILRRVGSSLSGRCARTRQEKDILLLATVLWGVRSLLPLEIQDKGNVQDIFYTLIRPALQALDDATCEISMALRTLLGLGDEALGQGGSALQLQKQIQSAVGGMHKSKHWLRACIHEAIERQTMRGAVNLIERARRS